MRSWTTRAILSVAALLTLAGTVPADRRGTAYGVFNTGYGVFWFAGSALMGYLYDVSISSLVAFSIAAQLVSIPIIAVVRRGREASG